MEIARITFAGDVCIYNGWFIAREYFFLLIRLYNLKENEK